MSRVDSINYTLLVLQLKKHEGLKLKPYRDKVDKLTIGYGRNLDDKGISDEEAEIFLMNDIKECEKQLEGISWYENLGHSRQIVIINMCYNLGIKGLKGFKNMIKAVKENDFYKAAYEMLDSKWAEQVGERAKELAEQMRTGFFKE
jgi:lysozyme